MLRPRATRRMDPRRCEHASSRWQVGKGVAHGIAIERKKHLQRLSFACRGVGCALGRRSRLFRTAKVDDGTANPPQACSFVLASPASTLSRPCRSTHPWKRRPSRPILGLDVPSLVGIAHGDQAMEPASCARVLASVLGEPVPCSDWRYVTSFPQVAEPAVNRTAADAVAESQHKAGAGTIDCMLNSGCLS